jgi:predicted transcriptional regulator
MDTVGHSETVDGIAARLEGTSAVLVLDGGHPIGILTQSDLLTFLGDH